MGTFYKYTLGLLVAICAGSACAEESIRNNFSGFASFGLTSNDNPDLYFRRDVTQYDGTIDGNVDWKTDSLVGLQWQTLWNYQFETTAQLVIKDRLNNNFNETVEWAFARYRPVDTVNIRIGRMGTDIFMQSDYHQVTYAQPWVRPPHDTYSLLPFFHFDGVDISKRLDVYDGTLNIKAYYGSSNQKYPLGHGKEETFHLAFDGGGISFNWEKDFWKLHYSYTNVVIKNNDTFAIVDALHSVAPLWPEAEGYAQRFNTKGEHLNYHQAGIGYDNNDWWLQSEATKVDTGASLIQSTRHFYISAGRRIDAFTLYGVRGFAHTAKSVETITAPNFYPPQISQALAALAYGTSLSFNNSRAVQYSSTLGVRWDFTSKMALKFQAEQFNIDKDGAALWIRKDPTAPHKNETAHVFSLSLDILF